MNLTAISILVVSLYVVNYHVLQILERSHITHSIKKTVGVVQVAHLFIQEPSKIRFILMIQIEQIVQDVRIFSAPQKYTFNYVERLQKVLACAGVA